MDETKVIITLSEYEELKKIKKDFIKKIAEDKVYLFISSMTYAPFGRVVDSYYLTTRDNVILALNDTLNKMNDEIIEIRKENYELELNKKKSWFN